MKIKEMKLSELRDKFPGIISNSKEKFIAQLTPEQLEDQVVVTPVSASQANIKASLGLQQTDDELTISEELLNTQLVEQIDKVVPTVLLESMYKLIGCSCKVEALVYFLDALNTVTPDISDMLIQVTYELFGERVKKTGCSGCIRNRIKRIRDHIESNIKLD